MGWFGWLLIIWLLGLPLIFCIIQIVKGVKSNRNAQKQSRQTAEQTVNFVNLDIVTKKSIVQQCLNSIRNITSKYNNEEKTLIKAICFNKNVYATDQTNIYAISRNGDEVVLMKTNSKYSGVFGELSKLFEIEKDVETDMHPKSWTDFWRCIFLWQKKETSRKSIARSSKYLL